jgi:hypothetical protein
VNGLDIGCEENQPNVKDKDWEKHGPSEAKECNLGDFPLVESLDSISSRDRTQGRICRWQGSHSIEVRQHGRYMCDLRLGR